MKTAETEVPVHPAQTKDDLSRSTMPMHAVGFQDYLTHAMRSRAYEEEIHEDHLALGRARKSDPSVAAAGTTEKEALTSKLETLAAEESITDSQRERMHARRALRSASWAAVFYLITTDIFGPFNAPYAISQVGYVPGVLLYFFMGLVAAYTGLLLWYLFRQLDSDLYPVRSYSDLSSRILGRWSAHVMNVLQSVQLIVNVGTICLSNGQSLAQITKTKLCFVVCILIWALVGMLIGQIRTLKNYGWLANSAVWFNLLLIFISMGFVAHSPPNYEAAMNSFGIPMGPVETQAFVSLPLASKVNGIMNMVFAYGGAMIFPEILSEMRRPWDFWKGMVCAQMLIFSAYMLYGVFIYSHQGQFTQSLAFYGVSKYAWQTVGNVLAIITGSIAAGLYGNIGIKVTYYNIVEGMFKGPILNSPAGRKIWSVMVLLYWSLAFLVGAAIPQVQTISGLVAAVCIMQFTYTFPPLLVFGFIVKKEHLHPDVPIPFWQTAFKWSNFVLFLAAASMAGLGMYGSGTAISLTFQKSVATSFGCSAPV